MAYEAGKTERTQIQRADIHSKQELHSFEHFKNIQIELSNVKVKLQGKTSLQITQMYSPTNDYDDETVEKLYEELERAVDKKSCRHYVYIIMGDFNAKVAVKLTT